MSDRVVAWLLRGVWAPLAFTVWPALAGGLRHQAGAVRTTAAVGGWAVWAAVLVATLVPAPVGLTALRCAAPAVLAAVVAWAVWAVILVATLVPTPLGLTGLRCAAPAVLAAAVAAAATGNPSAAAAALAVGWATLVTVIVALPATGLLCVNGPAYPNERRFPLAPPGALLVGPVELAWALVVAPLPAAALLLASGHWVLGGLVTVAAVPCTAVCGRALHQLSRRWFVCVPAGVVLHDPTTLREPVLFTRAVVEHLGPAPPGSDSLDMTQGAPGLRLELRLAEKVPMVLRRGRGRDEHGASARLLFAPTRPGLVLTEAAARRLPVGAPAGSAGDGR